MKIPEIYIVIVTYNAEIWIDACVESIVNSSIKAHIVIVDNLSTDKTVQIIENKYPQFHLIKNQVNSGFGVGNNIGMQFALDNHADYIVLLNQDAKLDSHTLEGLYNYSLQFPEYGILAPMFYSYDGSQLDKYLLRWVFSYNLELASDIYFNRPKEVYDITLAPAAMWFMRKEAIEEVGGFDPLFFMYGEDDDLWKRMSIRGWKTGFFPKTLVYHHTPKDTYSLKKRLWYRYAANINFLKNNNRSYFKNVLYFLRDYFKNTIIALIDLNKSELYVTQKVFLKTVMKLGLISKNRRLSLQQKKTFL